MISPFIRYCTVLCLIVTMWISGSVHADDDESSAPVRVTIFLSSSDDILGDLEHLVVDLADEEEQWNENVFPNIDIFLIGVDGARPIFFDQVMDAEHARRPQMAIPVSDLDEFILDNLDPLGIIVTPMRRQKGYYELEDVYEGWMRMVDDYAAFGEHEGDVPETLPSPEEANQELLSRGFDVGIQLNNALTTVEQRAASFETFRENTLAAVKKRPQETNEEFALRETTTGQNLEILERVFVQSSEVMIGMIVDSDESEGRGEFLLTAVPDSELAATIALQVQEHSYFASLESADDATLSGRVHFTLDELLQRHFDELLPLTRSVIMQQVDNNETYTDEQKDARKELAGIILDMFMAGDELGKVDLAVEIQPADDGLQNMVAGIRVTDGGPAERIVELLPQVNSMFETELNVEDAGDISIHTVTFASDYPEPLADFFGDSARFYVATGPDALWFAGGPDGLELLKSSIDAVAAESEGDVDATIARLDMHTLPVLKLLRGIRDDGTLDLMSLLPSRTAEEPAEEDEADEESTASMLKDFEWGEATLEALSGEDDRLHLEIHRQEDRLEGTGSLQQGILKAIGELIAKFAKENLG